MFHARRVGVSLRQDSTFVASVCKLLKPCFAAPLDFVFREGEIGLEMYFVQSGSVEILCVHQGEELHLDFQEQAPPRTRKVAVAGRRQASEEAASRRPLAALHSLTALAALA